MTAPAPEPTGPSGVDERDSNRILYWIIGGVVVVLAIIGLITYSSHEATAEAQEKAQQLTQMLEEAGLNAPDQDILVRTLGTDGGAVCDNPSSALGRATLLDQMVNGAATVGRRPVIVDRRVILGELAILQVYCPDEVQDFRDHFDDLEFDDVIRN
jgi:hypothetical protein